MVAHEQLLHSASHSFYLHCNSLGEKKQRYASLLHFVISSGGGGWGEEEIGVAILCILTGKVSSFDHIGDLLLNKHA